MCAYIDRCAVVVDRSMVSLLAVSPNIIECILSDSEIYSICCLAMLSYRDTRKKDYDALYTHERGTPFVSVYLLHDV